MRTVTAEPRVPRADAPRALPATRGWFPYAETRLRGLDPVFWALLLYLFVGIAALDEEWAAVARLRPRLILGGLVLAAAAVRIAVAAMRSREGPAPPDATTTWWGLYLAATLLSAVWAFDFDLALEALLAGRLASLLAFALLVTLVRTRRQFLVVVLVCCAGYGFYLLRSFQEFFAGRMYAKAEGVRMVGMGERYADPNSFAATIAFSLPLVLWAGIHTRSWLLRACVFCYGVLAAVAVVLTKSRSGLILIALTAIWFVFALPTRRARVLAVLLLVAGAGVGSLFVPERTLQRYLGIATGGSTASERESTMGRVEGYEVAYEILRQNPVLGIGPGNWAAYRMRKVDGDTMMPHNLAGQLLATLGLLGTFAFAMYLLVAVRAGVRARRGRRTSTDPWDGAVRRFASAMLFMLLLLFVSGLAAHNLERENWYWGPAMLIVAATCRPEPRPWPTEPAT